jgi:hypothetical protein
MTLRRAARRRGGTTTRRSRRGSSTTTRRNRRGRSITTRSGSRINMSRKITRTDKPRTVCGVRTVMDERLTYHLLNDVHDVRSIREMGKWIHRMKHNLVEQELGDRKPRPLSTKANKNPGGVILNMSLVSNLGINGPPKKIVKHPEVRLQIPGSKISSITWPVKISSL